MIADQLSGRIIQSLNSKQKNSLKTERTLESLQEDSYSLHWDLFLVNQVIANCYYSDQIALGQTVLVN